MEDENFDKISFNDMLREKTKKLAVRIIKMYTVLPKTDETVFWLELLRDTNIVTAEKLFNLEEEALSVLKIVAKMRKNAYKNVKLTRN